MAYSIFDLGYDSTLSRDVGLDSDTGSASVIESDLTSYSGGLGSNPTESAVAASSIASGSLPALLYSGKQYFTDPTAGYRMGVDGGVYKWIIGDAVSSADWAVTAASTFTIKGTITATAGSIGGWTINATNLSASGIVLDSGNQRITVGSAVPNIIIDGVNKYVRTSTYTTGSNGWTINEDGSAEFNNLFARGEFQTQTLSYGSVHVTAGSNILALSGGSLKNDVSPSLTTYILLETGDAILLETGDNLLREEGAGFELDVNDPPSGHVQVFSVGDILRIKDGSGDDSWMTVASVSDETTHYQYSCTLSSGSSTTFYAGAAVADYGQSGQGLIYSTVDGTNAPYISVQTHAGSPWSSITEMVRLGNLNGYLDYATDLYGLAVGSSTGTNANITIDSTNGIRIRQGTTNVFSVDNAGTASVGALVVAAGGSIRSGMTAYLTGTGYWIGNVTTTPKLSIGNPAGNYLAWDGSSLSVVGTFYGTVSGTAVGIFTTTQSNNTSRVSIADGIYGTPSQPANSIGFVSGSVCELAIRVPPSNVYAYIEYTDSLNGVNAARLIKAVTATTSSISGYDEGMFNLSASSADGSVDIILITNAGNGYPLKISQTKASPTYAPIVVSGGLTSTKFRRLISGSNRTVWESTDTTSPNTALTGTAGDLCMCGDGNIYRCTGTTSWTAM